MTQNQKKVVRKKTLSIFSYQRQDKNIIIFGIYGKIHQEILKFEAYAPSLLFLPFLKKCHKNLLFAVSEPKMSELTIKHEKCFQVSYKQGNKITHPLPKCKLQKNCTEYNNFLHKATFLHLIAKRCYFQWFFSIVHIYISDVCIFVAYLY